MNRRNFLKSIGKICAVLPFVGSSSAVAKTGAPKGQPKAPMCATEVAERYGVSPTADTLPEIKEFDRTAQDECERLYKIERMRIEAAEKAANPPTITKPKVNLRNYPVRHIDDDDNSPESQAFYNLPDEFKPMAKERHSGWKFYVNGKEVDSGRAVDKLGALHWPFQGAKEGDLCTAKSPKVVMAHCPNRFMFTI